MRAGSGELRPTRAPGHASPCAPGRAGTTTTAHMAQLSWQMAKNLNLLVPLDLDSGGSYDSCSEDSSEENASEEPELHTNRIQPQHDVSTSKQMPMDMDTSADAANAAAVAAATGPGGRAAVAVPPPRREKSKRVKRTEKQAGKKRKKEAEAERLKEQEATYADGETYAGEWCDGKKNGRGTYKWADGSMYEGDWVDNEMHGAGRETYANGPFKVTYEGEWVRGKRHGAGKMTWAGGSMYEGEWVDGKDNGTGRMTYANGQTAAGKMIKGKWKPEIVLIAGKPLAAAEANKGTLQNQKVFIGDSTIGPQGGKGLFVTHEIGKGEVISKFEGKVVEPGEDIECTSHVITLEQGNGGRQLNCYNICKHFTASSKLTTPVGCYPAGCNSYFPVTDRSQDGRSLYEVGLAAFVNSSLETEFEPNCRVEKLRFHGGEATGYCPQPFLIATRALIPGEEVLFDYAYPVVIEDASDPAGGEDDAPDDDSAATHKRDRDDAQGGAAAEAPAAAHGEEDEDDAPAQKLPKLAAPSPAPAPPTYNLAAQQRAAGAAAAAAPGGNGAPAAALASAPAPSAERGNDALFPRARRDNAAEAIRVGDHVLCCQNFRLDLGTLYVIAEVIRPGQLCWRGAQAIYYLKKARGAVYNDMSLLCRRREVVPVTVAQFASLQAVRTSADMRDLPKFPGARAAQALETAMGELRSSIKETDEAMAKVNDVPANIRIALHVRIVHELRSKAEKLRSVEARVKKVRNDVDAELNRARREAQRKELERFRAKWIGQAPRFRGGGGGPVPFIDFADVELLVQRVRIGACRAAVVADMEEALQHLMPPWW